MVFVLLLIDYFHILNQCILFLHIKTLLLLSNIYLTLFHISYYLFYYSYICIVMLIIAFSNYSLFTARAHWKVILIKKYSAKIKYIKGKKNTATDTLNQLDYIPTKSDNSNTIKYIFSLMQHKIELISSSINLISTAQDKNDKLIKRILQKNK